jgi:uncharacterized coiled-coil protein SlyX
MNYRSSKAIKALLVISIVWVVSGCEMLTKMTQQSSIKSFPESSLCVTETQKDNFDVFCKSSQWLEFIIEAQDLGWPQRMQMISSLDEETHSLLKKILLSQGVDTPYQHRLRAQNWIENITIDASDTMKIVLNELLYENSKQLLEFESAITILSRINSRQEKTISELQLLLTEREQVIQTQQDQVEQLLKIETDLIEQNRNEER